MCIRDRIVRSIGAFLVDEVSNWHVRRSRERFWSNEFDTDKKSAYLTLYEVLLALSKLMAPFAPFISEDIYLNLTGGKALESVHFEAYPEVNEALIDSELEERMGLVITLEMCIRDSILCGQGTGCCNFWGKS